METVVLDKIPFEIDREQFYKKNCVSTINLILYRELKN
jgi:hypothetical protein